MFQPPLSIGSLLARRCTTVPQSSAWKSVFMPMRFSVSAATCASAQIVGIVDAARITTFSPL